MNGSGSGQSSAGEEKPWEGYSQTGSRSHAGPIPAWAEHFEVGDTIRWVIDSVDEVQESEIIGFSTQTPLGKPVIEMPDVLDDGDDVADAIRVTENVWVPDDSAIAKIEMEYRQTMTVTIPVEEMPKTEEHAFHLVKHTDPEFIGDVLPNRWDDAVSVGELEVMDLQEEEP